jgi:lincosamide nucleotidyltransferase
MQWLWFCDWSCLRKVIETVLPQHSLIERTIELCRSDERFVAVMQAGSFTEGEGDRWSDVDFWLCVDDEALPDLDRHGWVTQVAPLLACFQNEFGTEVAIFEGLVRGEFHFAPASEMAEVRTWPFRDERLNVEAMVALDRTGELREHLSAVAEMPSERLSAPRLQSIQDRFLNWFLFGINVLLRGDLARSLDILSHVQRHLLWLARSSEGKVERHYFTPAKRAADDLTPASFHRYVKTVARLDEGDLRRAYREAWSWYEELAEELSNRFRTDPRPALIEALRQRVAELD